MNRRSIRIQLDPSSSWTAALWPQCSCCFQRPGAIRLPDDEYPPNMPRHAAHPRTYLFSQNNDMEFEALLSDDDEHDSQLLEDNDGWLENDAELVPVDCINRLLKVNQELSPMMRDIDDDIESRPKRESLPQPYTIHDLPHTGHQVDPSSSDLMEEDTAVIVVAEQEEEEVILQGSPSLKTEDLPTLLVETDSDEVEPDPFSLLSEKRSFISKEQDYPATPIVQAAEQTEVPVEMEAEIHSVSSPAPDQPLVDNSEQLKKTFDVANDAIVDVPETVPTTSFTHMEEAEEKEVAKVISEPNRVSEENEQVDPVTDSQEAQTVDSIQNVQVSTSSTPNEPQLVKDQLQRPTHGRRTSVAQVAQSYLGDKLEDLTEKLTFIKKNIIMSLEEEEDEEEEPVDPPHSPRPSRSQPVRLKSMPKPHLTPSEMPVSQRPQRISSLPKSMPLQNPKQDYTPPPQPPRPSVERFNSFQEEASASFSRIFSKMTSSNDRSSFSPSSFFAALAGTEEEPSPTSAPQSPVSGSEVRPPPARTSSRAYADQRKMEVRSAEQRVQGLRRPGARTSINMFEESNADQEGEVVFDFGKVLEIGRTLGKSLGEDVMQNGLKVFNDMSDRMKNVKRRGSGEDNWLGRDSWL